MSNVGDLVGKLCMIDLLFEKDLSDDASILYMCKLCECGRRHSLERLDVMRMVVVVYFGMMSEGPKEYAWSNV